MLLYAVWTLLCLQDVNYQYLMMYIVCKLTYSFHELLSDVKVYTHRPVLGTLSWSQQRQIFSSLQLRHSSIGRSKFMLIWWCTSNVVGAVGPRPAVWSPLGPRRRRPQNFECNFKKGRYFIMHFPDFPMMLGEQQIPHRFVLLLILNGNQANRQQFAVGCEQKGKCKMFNQRKADLRVWSLIGLQTVCCFFFKKGRVRQVGS